MCPNLCLSLSCCLWKMEGLGGGVALSRQPGAQHPPEVINAGLEKRPESAGKGGRQAGCPFKAFPSSFFIF